MKVLHLFSDWRWTGPAEPVVMLCKKLAERGINITLACRTPPIEHPQNLVNKALERDITVTTQLFLNRYFSPRENLVDMIRLPQYLVHEEFDLLHTHLSHHLITISRQALQGDQQNFGLKPDQVSLIYSGIDPQRFQPRARNPLFASLLGLKEGAP